MQKVEDKIYRMNIRGTADRTGAIQGYTHVEGDITFECAPDLLLYFLYASRMTPVKTGAGPYTYTFAPSFAAQTSTAAGAGNRKTLSMLITRSGLPRGYVGCSVGQLAFSLDNGLLMCTASVIGTDEATQTAGTPTWPVGEPVGPGDITLEVPTATARADAETFTLTINDNLTQAQRLNGQRKAAYATWGEREVTFGMDFDYSTLTDYTTFINQTNQAVSIKGIVTAATEEVTITLNGTFQDTHQVNLSSMGDIVRAHADYHAVAGALDAYTIVVKTAEIIT
jgi:hypothetical protein